MNPDLQFKTIAVHAGTEPEPNTGAIMTPIFMTSTYVQDAPGVHKGYDYSRADNPTREAHEKALAAIERGATKALAFSSGLAAEQAVIQLLNPGDRIVVCDDVGSFWRPFTIQENWDRHFGFHWDLITSPKVINGSNEVLVWDLLSFYAPVVILITGLILFWRQPKQWSLPVQVGFLMATLIACAHSGLAFLTHDRFMSLGRHVLANPLLFMAGLVLLQATPRKHEAPVRNVLRFLLVASVVFLGMWWFRFTRDQWIG